MKTALEEVLAVPNRILLELVRMRRNLIFWTVFPALMLLLFGLIYAGGGRTRASFDSTTPGILIGAALFFSCLGGPVALIVTERERRTLRRLLLSPLKPVSYFLGIVFAHLIIASGQGVIVYGISFAFGGRLHLLMPTEMDLGGCVDALHGIRLASVALQPVHLEHAYMEITRRDATELPKCGVS